MATTPGILTHWPWEPLGNFKYIVVAPWLIHSVYSFIVIERDLVYVTIVPFILFRMLHNQLWITYARYRTAKGKNLIIDRSLEFEQVDREKNWDDQMIFMVLLYYIAYWGMDVTRNLPFWRTDGLVLMFVLHISLVEFLYYWLHRALHHHYLYSRYHSHHHSSIVTEPITSVNHPFAEHIFYYFLFIIPMLTSILLRTGSIAALAIYTTYIDLMNNMGHCNFELIPKWLFTAFPPLKYLVYTPSYHSLHHTQFRTNYCLFVPFYDYIYGTMDKSTDSLYEASLQRPEDVPDAIYLTHPTTLQSIYHLRVGFSAFASNPLIFKWYLWLMSPLTLWSMILALIYGRTFVVESNTFNKIKLQSWAIPRYNLQYRLKWQREAINKLIEKAILEADEKGIKVVTLGLLNQAEELNKKGEMYLRKHPNLKVKLVDGSSLAVAVVINSIPEGTSKLVFRGKPCKLAVSIVSHLCHKGIQVTTIRKDDYDELKKALSVKDGLNLILPEKNWTQKLWLVGENVHESEQLLAPKGTIFIPLSQFPPKKMRKDCFYLNTPSLSVPKSYENLHYCENWLPRRIMSAWRVAGILHALEGWNNNECGDKLLDVDKVWQAALRHGFKPQPTPA